MNTSPGHCHSTNLKRACRWCPATCQRRSSTRRRQACPAAAGRAAAWSCTSTTRGTPGRTTAGTGDTRPSTTRTTWATRACSWAGARCITSTSLSSGARSTSTPPPTLTRPYTVWRRRCRTPPRICTGSERGATHTLN